MAKAPLWAVTDAKTRKLGEQTGLDTLVVQAVNDGYSVSEDLTPSVPQANALSTPPGKYGRKVETQRN